ncbi:beta-1,3-galactosyltransferase 15 [Carex littledalei]|uniref:Beta-1,3-galactosyltransferase 15 n=1 Tax=Carex littledalei TaxID=544730 RepID=A0A833V1T5_9POAL|nr:beta-1,3-galactosyltransferase 15 [Carex littledalei]
MKKWPGGTLLASLLTILVLRYMIWDSPLAESSLQAILYRNNSDPLLWLDVPEPLVVQEPKNASQVISIENLFSTLVLPRNLSKEEMRILHTWNHLKHLGKSAHRLPQGVEAIKEASDAWEKLMVSVKEEKLSILANNGSGAHKGKEKQCPYSIRQMNASGLGVTDGFSLKIPCGLVHGSSLTFIGTPEGIFGEFKIDLTGSTVPGEPYMPILLHYNVRLGGDKLTEDPVIVQNTWTVTDEWGSEERCPPDGEFDETAKVDDLAVCNSMVGKDEKQTYPPKARFNVSIDSLGKKQRNETRKYFPFKRGHLAIAILRVGSEGMHMTVDGKHITSFAFRESLEPWLASEVKISGEIKLLSVIASGLPTSEELDHVVDLELLKAPPLSVHKTVNLVIGVFSNANNFKRRMSIRRTWMQYDAVRSGSVVVRFFVGLHKNQIVNEELWNEARTYGDVQLMPFVDYYSLITWKTIAICIYGTNVVSAKYIMKTDDDAFVRVDEILESLKQVNSTSGLLFGKINFDSEPHRDPDSKWHITAEEYPEEKYPPWAHGPGYIVSRNIAKTIFKQYKKGHLKMFKLEDVAMGIWVDEMKKAGTDVQYVTDERILTGGCEMGYILAHYQEPREMLCLWEKLQSTKRAVCCGDQ